MHGGWAAINRIKTCRKKYHIYYFIQSMTARFFQSLQIYFSSHAFKCFSSFCVKAVFKLCLTSWIGYRINYLVDFEKLSNFVDNLFYCLQLGGAGRGVTLSAQGNSLKPKVSIGQYCFIQRFFWTCSDSSLIIYLSFCIHLCICNWQSSNAR